MLKKEILNGGLVRVTFRVSHEIWADRIALVGEFNDWDAHLHLIRQTRADGEWHISLELEAGRLADARATLATRTSTSLRSSATTQVRPFQLWRRTT